MAEEQGKQKRSLAEKARFKSIEAGRTQEGKVRLNVEALGGRAGVEVDPLTKAFTFKISSEGNSPQRTDDTNLVGGSGKPRRRRRKPTPNQKEGPV
jgi:hypothetical protein